MISLMITIGIINLLAAMSPGPDFAIVAHNAGYGSRRAGIATAMGIGCALLIHASYCMLGLGILIAQSSLILHGLKWIGGAYIIYLGIKALISPAAKTDNTSLSKNPQIPASKISLRKAFSSGFLTCALNPKVILFIIALFTMVHAHYLSTYQNLFIMFEIPVIGITWFSCLSWMITHPRIYKHYRRHLRKITLGFGFFLIAVGMMLILE